MSKKSKIEKGLCTHAHCRNPSQVIVAYVNEEYCDKHYAEFCEKR